VRTDNGVLSDAKPKGVTGLERWKRRARQRTRQRINASRSRCARGPLEGFDLPRVPGPPKRRGGTDCGDAARLLLRGMLRRVLRQRGGRLVIEMRSPLLFLSARLAVLMGPRARLGVQSTWRQPLG
jgi:hypothetical protein